MNNAQKKTLGYGMQQLAARREWCFWPGSECNNRAIRAHSVQNSKVLKLLSTQGHVITPRFNLTSANRPQMVFKPVGRNLATTFTGLCGKHDHKLFAPIETCAIRISDQMHLFLLAYRAVLKELHASRKSFIDTTLTFQKAVANKIYPQDEPSPLGEQDLEQFFAFHQVNEVKSRLDAAYLASDWNVLDHRVIIANTEPTIAVNSIFSTNQYSERLDGPVFVMLNVFPITDIDTAIIFSSLACDMRHAEVELRPIWSSTGYYQLYQISKLILKKCGNLVLSPDYYNSISSDIQDIILEYFTRNYAHSSYDIDCPGLYLFKDHIVTGGSDG